MKNLVVTLAVFTAVTLFVSCEKDKEIELNPVYGPAQERQFGEESALVQELSYNPKHSGLYRI